jgi:RNA-directed DNA polymerase
MQSANLILTTSPENDLSISWNAIDWQVVNRRVNNLRRRIYRASVDGNLKVVSSLQKLMLKSRSNRLLAIRRVTQINQGVEKAQELIKSLSIQRKNDHGYWIN